jgi:hypothetical protein
MKRNVLKGAECDVMAHLLIEGSIDVLELTVLQAKDDSGTIRDRKGIAQSRIARLKPVARDLGMTIENQDPSRSTGVWVLVGKEKSGISFSVDFALALATEAQGELGKGKFCVAFAKAHEALEYDDCVQPAHEALGKAALAIGQTPGVDEKRISETTLFLGHRRRQLAGVQKIINRSFLLVDDEDARDTMRHADDRFSNEEQRLATILAKMIEKFGDPYNRDLPQDKRANAAIEKLRQLGLSYEQASSHGLAKTMLEHPSVERLRDKMEKEAREAKLGDAAENRKTVGQIVLMKALDLRIVPRIRLICSHAKPEVRQALGLPSRNGTMAGEAKKLRKAKAMFFAEHGHHPNTEEVAKLLGWTACKVEDVEAWIRANNPGGPTWLEDEGKDEHHPDEHEDGGR